MTAEEFLEQPEHHTVCNDSFTRNAMIEFAKYHVEQAIRAIEQKGLYDITSWSGNPYTGEGSDYLDVEKMLDAYPDKNFK